METVGVHYPSRQAMVKGVMTMTGDGWQVCGIATLAENCYRVEFARQVASELADDTDLAWHTVGYCEPARHLNDRTNRPR